MTSLCKEINCKHWSDGRKSEGGTLGGYGCSLYLTANDCPVALIQGVISTQHQLDLAEGAMPMATRCAIACLPLTEKDIEISRIAPIREFSDHPSLKKHFTQILYPMRNSFYLASRVELVRIFPQQLSYGNLGDPYREFAQLLYTVYPDEQSQEALKIEIVDAVRLAHFIGTDVSFCVDPELSGHSEYQSAQLKLFGVHS